MDLKTNSASHGPIFTLLVISVLVAVGTSLLHLPALLNNIVVLTVAFFMAALVVAQYMGLSFEGKLVRWVVVVPFVLFAILVGILLPDIGHMPLQFLGKF